MKIIHLSIVIILFQRDDTSGQQQTTCTIKSDVIFLLDHSGSIRDGNPANGSWDNWELIKDFVVSIVEGTEVGYENTHIGLATFGNYALSRIELNAMFDKSKIIDTIRALGAGIGNTNTYAGLKLLRRMFDIDRGGRYGVPHIGIIITDGKATIDAGLTTSEAASLYYAGITIFAIGITDDIDEKQLRSLSSPPQLKEQNYWMTLDFRGLTSILQRVQNAACFTQPINETGCRSLDLVFSVSIPNSKQDWNLVKNFITEFLNFMPISSNSVRMALVTYDAFSAENRIQLDSYSDKEALKRAVDSLPDSQWLISYSDPTKALAYIRTNTFTERNGYRRNSSHVVVLLLDEENLNLNRSTFESEVKLLLEASVHVIFVDVRGKLAPYLEGILNSRRDVITGSGYNFMMAKVGQLVNIVCMQYGSGVACPGKSDVIIAIDTSSKIIDYVDTSIVWIDYYLLFIKSFIQSFDVGSDGTRFCVLTFNEIVEVLLEFESSVDVSVVERVIDGVRPSGYYSKVNLSKALRKSNSIFLHSQRNVPKLFLLISYEYPTDPMDQILREASILKIQAHMFVMGVTLGRRYEEKVSMLKDLSSNPDGDHIFVIDHFRRLNSFLVYIIDSACQHIVGDDKDGDIVISTSSPEIKSDCKPADVAILIDTCTNIDRDLYNQYYLQFIANLVQKIDIESNKIRVAMVTFSEDANIEFYFDTYNTTKEILLAISRLPYNGHTSNFQKAISLTIDQVFNGSRMDPLISKMIIIITSNPSTSSASTIKEAQRARSKGIIITAVGVGTHLNIHELSAITSYPYRKYLFVVNSTRNMFLLVDPLKRIVCYDDDNCLFNASCLHGGNCTQVGGAVGCQCPPRYVGPRCEAQCSKGSDIIFIIDSSRSKSLEEFQKVTAFVSDVIQYLDVDWPDGSRVGLMMAGDVAMAMFQLIDYSSKIDLLLAVNVPFIPSVTCDSEKALKLARESMFTPSNGDRVNHRNVIVIITDGLYDNETGSWLEAVESRRHDISIMAIGVGNHSQINRLQQIASHPHSNNIILISNYSELDNSSIIKDMIASQLCENTNHCSSNPCKNGATCENILGGFKCGPCPIHSTGYLCERNCTGEIDLLFLLFVGTSLRQERLQHVKNFIINIVLKMDIHPARTRVALAYWAEIACVHFHLLEFEARQDVAEAITRVPYLGGKSNMAAGLGLMMMMFKVQHGGRNHAKKIAVVVTNAESDMNSEEVVEKVQEAKVSGILMMTVTIESSMKISHEIETMTSFPRDVFRFHGDDFIGLHSLVGGVVAATCNSVNECSSNPCLNEGHCIDDYNLFYCVCKPGYARIHCQSKCTSRLDLALIIDISGSVLNDCDRAINLSIFLTQGLDVDSDLVRVAYVAFSTKVLHWFDLRKFIGDKRSILDSFDFNNKGGLTNIKGAFDHVSDRIFKQESGDRPEVPNVIIIMTDGFANVDHLTPTHGADELKGEGVEIFVVGIGDEVDMGELMVMASHPWRRHVWRLESKEGIEVVGELLLGELCGGHDDDER